MKQLKQDGSSTRAVPFMYSYKIPLIVSAVTFFAFTALSQKELQAAVSWSMYGHIMWQILQISLFVAFFTSIGQQMFRASVSQGWWSWKERTEAWYLENEIAKINDELSTLRLSADERITFPKPATFLGILVSATFITHSLSSGTAKSNPNGSGPLVHGTINGIIREGAAYFITGWTIQEGVNEPLRVHVYADGSAYDKPPGEMIIGALADLPTNPGINTALHCDPTSKHDFKIALPESALSTLGGRKIYVHGIRAINGTSNTALRGSGDYLFPCPMLKGTYVSSPAHPRVFVTKKELSEMAARANVPNSFSSQMFAKLTHQIEGDLASKQRYNVAYSGTDVDVYLRTFSYESAGGYKEEVRSDRELCSELNLPPDSKPPRGAAIVASRLALYAGLAKAGARSGKDAPGADQAAALAKNILLTWAEGGFREKSGKFLRLPGQFSENGKFTEASAAGVPLQVSRGMIYSIYAQDVLEGLDTFTKDEIKKLDGFHSALAQIVRHHEKPGATFHGLPCNCFGNHTANDLAGELAAARLADDEEKFYAVLYGGDRSYEVNLPWTLFFNKTIYGKSDTPNLCYSNTGANSRSSHPFFQTATAAPGEIDDRFRNENPAQGIGYPMFTLQRLFNAAQILKNAGFDPYSYRGNKGESMELAAQYYAAFARAIGFEQLIDEHNCSDCQNYEQYIGKNTSEAPNMVTAAYLFPNNKVLHALDGKAKLEMRRGFGLDAVEYGRWTD